MLSAINNGRNAVMTIDAELKVPEVTVQVARFQVMQSSENSFCRPEGFWLDLSITPRTPNARVCFKERWASHRFEPPGRLFMLPPGEVLKTRSDGGSQTSVICLVQKHLFQQWLGDTFEWTERRLAASLNIPCEAVQRLLSRLGEEARHPGFASQAFSEAMAIQIVIELSRYYLGMKDEPAAGGLSAWRLRLIDERLREVRSPPTLTDLAALCGLSVRQLSRGFRVNRACSIGDYISQTRIENAKRLLLTGETVKSIAFSMGFGSPSGFCYAFRRATGRTPRQYRQQEALSFRSRLN